ncbi:MAG TPA: MFS transporter [Acidimicrobiales bacterium]|nr:MFS transporter [Acidimicrobiales bacterium]
MPAPHEEAADPRRYLVLAVVTLVAFVTNLDATIVVVALPRLVASLHTTVTTGLWTVTAYVLSTTVFLLPAGRFSDGAGRRGTFVAGLVLFAAGTVACGVATSGGELVVLRFVQGAGGALGVATGTPILAETFPRRELGRAIGLYSMAWVLGSIIGPIAGGAIVDSLGWRWIFFATAPFAVAGAVLGVVVLRPDRRRPLPRLDWTGMAAFALALTALLLALTEGFAWGWGSPRVVGLLVVALGALGAFAAVERRAGAPLFDLALLASRTYRRGLVVVVCYATAFFATTFLLTFYLQGSLGLTPLHAGLLLIPLSAPQILLAPAGGHLADRLGPLRPMVAGLVLLGVAAVWCSRLSSMGSPLDVIAPLLLMSAANGLAWPGLVKAVLQTVSPERSGVASGMFFTLRSLGTALSFTLALVVAEASLPRAVALRIYLGTERVIGAGQTRALARATDAGFLAFAALYLVAVVVACGLYRRDRGRPAGAAAAGE